MTIERLQRSGLLAFSIVLTACVWACSTPDKSDASETEGTRMGQTQYPDQGMRVDGPSGPAPAPESMTVALPGGLVEIELLLVRGGICVTEGGTFDVAPFWLARTETTWDAYDVMVFRLDLPESERAGGTDGVARPTKPYINVDRGFGHAGYPALSMSAQGAQSFCAWLSQATGKRFRLPTPAELEWAARVGHPMVEGPALLEALPDLAWYRDNSGRKTHPVGEKRANAWGFHDLLGNVAEWTVDADGRACVVGGSFADSAQALTSGARREPAPSWNASDPQVPKSVWWLADANFVGFRIACDASEAD